MKALIQIFAAMAVLAATAALLPCRPAAADSLTARNIAVCNEVIARTLCKAAAEVEFIDRYMDTNNYSFTVFYAKKEERFVCNVSGNEVRIKGNAWTALLRTIELTPDPERPMCVILDYSMPECPRGPARFCAAISREEEQRQRELEFWNRPIPELLEDELRSGIAAEANRTEQQDASGEPPEEQ